VIEKDLNEKPELRIDVRKCEILADERLSCDSAFFVTVQQDEMHRLHQLHELLNVSYAVKTWCNEIITDISHSFMPPFVIKN
jgi:hypothetical protein